MISFQVFISEPLRKMRKPKNLPVVESSEAEAVIWFQGFWNGIGLGIVMGLGSAVIAGWMLGLL